MVGSYYGQGVYFAADDADKCVDYLQARAMAWFNYYVENAYIFKIKRSWDAYHGNFYIDGHKITYGGEQGELVNLAVNHYRNIATNIHNMVCSNRPAFQARATNLDSKSQVQTTLAGGLLEYYMREKDLESYLRKAVEYAIVLGSGYVKMNWNATAGKIYDYVEPAEPIDENGREIKPYPIYEGEPAFTNMSPFDVVFDTSKETYQENEWVLCRTFGNKYALAAKYPELKDDIINLKTKSDIDSRRFFIHPYDESVDVPVYEYFHKKNEALPNGRYLLYLSKDIILMDTPLPYRDIPVYRITCADFLGTPFGYTPMFDLIPIQTAINSLYSTILTNQNAFGVQSILNPRGNDVRVNQLEGGLNFIEYNAQFGAPTPLQLTQSPPEIFNFMQMLVKDMEVISGVNSIVRGNVPTDKMSGNAMALIQSQALQFVSGLQQSYIKLIEGVGTGLIAMLRDFAAVPRIAAISGIDNQTKLAEFTGDDLDLINRVVVDVANPLSQCLAKDTPILMFDGSIKMVQDIEIGEQIMGPDSKPRTIKNVNSGIEPMYTVTSKNKHRNIKYTCNESHILTLRYCSDDYRYNAKKGQEIDLTVRDYVKMSNSQKMLLQGFTTGVEFEDREQLIPSYIMGLWLGDGHSATTCLTTADKELLEEWTNCAKSFDLDIRIGTNDNSGNAKLYFITSSSKGGRHDRNPIMTELKNLNVIDNKHIPNIYLINSRKKRLELLAGILDTDGTLVSKSTFIFTQKSDRLTADVVFLAKSLGFRVTQQKLVREKTNLCDHETVINKVSIGGNTDEIPTRLPRKRAVKMEKRYNWLNYGIKVECIGEGTYYGFTLKEEPHFLLGDFTVTHNTTSGRVAMAEQMLQMKLLNSPEKYLEVMNTGKLTAITSSEDNENLLVRTENEHLLKGDIVVRAIYTDKHSFHIREHRTVLGDPKLRYSDPELIQRAAAHLDEHFELLRTTDPMILQALGETGMAPQMPPVNEMGNIPKQVENKEAATTASGAATPQLPGESPLKSLPSPAKPAQIKPEQGGQQ